MGLAAPSSIAFVCVSGAVWAAVVCKTDFKGKIGLGNAHRIGSVKLFRVRLRVSGWAEQDIFKNVPLEVVRVSPEIFLSKSLQRWQRM